MRLIAYALSAACGCAPVGYNYYNSNYYAPTAQVETVVPVYQQSASTWGGESALPIGYDYGYQPIYSPYFVGSPYMSYSYPRRHVRIDVEARNHHHPVPTTAIARAHKPTAKTKVAEVPLPKPRPKLHFPHKMVAIED
jgi:hypothetical protein